MRKVFIIMLKRIFISILLMTAITSCIGKVEDANLEEARNAESGKTAISFSGLTKVIPISHDKVELYFYPAIGPTSELTYLIKINNSIVPIEVKADSLMLTDEGLYIFTATGLDVNTDYTFSVGVRDGRDGSQSANDRTLATRTFSNYTADFAGISSVEPVVGSAGQNSVTVKWVPAVTLGSTFNAKPNDPVAYTISYIAAEDGGVSDLIQDNHPAIQREQNPSSLSSTPSGSTERERVITGLMPGKKYYFRVRAIHKAYASYGTLEGYKTEKNNKVMAVDTLSAGGLFDWNTNSLQAITPDGDAGLSKMGFSWVSAVGPFAGYRFYNVKMADATDSQAIAESNSAAAAVDTVYVDNLNASSDYETLAADDLSTDIINLDSYAYYRAFLVACRTITCGDGERIIGNPVLYRVVPKMASFSGILKINSPQDIANLNQIKIQFDAPVIETGYINEFDIYCYESSTDNSPTVLNYNVANTSGKPGCNGLTRLEPTPSYNGFSTFNEITIQSNFFAPGDTVADREYCFSAVPRIVGTNYTNSDLENAIIRCVTPVIKVPTIDDFPGVNTNTCTMGTDTLDVSWNAPTNGIYDSYVLFYRENDGTDFKFSDALAGDASYTRVDSITATNYTIPSLIPGKTYQFGVLPYVTMGTPIYGEFNVGVGNCTIPIPNPRFEEWVDIFAVGPKADGLITPTGPDRQKEYLFETLNKYGQPLEVEIVDGTYGPTSAFEDQFGQINGSNIFNGAYGSKDGDVSNGVHQYSNSGMIRIAWKDITFNSGSSTMSDMITTYETGAIKRDREVGYRVYRSDDNQLTWKDITSDDFEFQTVANKGLLHPEDYSERKRSNAAVDTFKAVMFTDYSVKSLRDENEFNRARIYYYKVVPVFKGSELEYDRENENPQHIIKVVLPPENMALVHRLMANRQTCMEVGKDHTTDVSQYYTCSWNGVGARGLSTPWINGTTVYDFGPSMLIDRFELGCNFTRGDYGNESSNLSGAPFDFFGLNDNGTKFKGCFNPFGSSGTNQTSGADHPAPGASYADRRQYRVGDCIGDDSTMMFPGDSTCSNPATSLFRRFSAPGTPDSTNFQDCSDADQIAMNFFNPYGDSSSYNGTATQSEFAAVFYNRNGTNSIYDQSTYGYYRGAGGAANMDSNNISLSYKNAPSRCLINIPVQDNSIGAMGSGRLKSRWLPVNKLNRLRHNGTDVDIMNSTLNEVISNNSLYDSGANSVPNSTYLDLAGSSRYRGDTKVARIFSSNDSKLPALTGLSQEQSNAVCEAYTVKVGTYNDDSNTFTQVGSDRQKRLMRRTEGIVANRYPKDFDDLLIDSLEKGTFVQTAETSGVSLNSSCNVEGRDIEDGVHYWETYSGESIQTRYTSNLNGSSANPSNPSFMTGSSFYDADGQFHSTQSCISRFGLQDVIGNLAEFSSEQFYCDFSGEQLMVGGGAPSNSISVGSGATYDSSLTAWVQSSPDTGRCSVSELGSLRSNTHSVSGTQIPIFDIFGNINTGVVGQENILDNSSIGFLRNGGDGFFFDFGQTNFAPPLSDNDTMSLFWTDNVKSRARDIGADPRRGRYFSPIFGMPLECQGSVCNTSDDNKSITLDEFVTSFSLLPSEFTISDFPVGNSQIFSDGMSEINVNIDEYKSPDTYAYSYNFIQSVDAGTGTSTTYADNNGGALKSSLDNDGISANRVWWRVNRGRMNIQNFGSSKDERTGRYNAFIRGVSESNESAYTTVGIRCAVRIEESNE